MYSADAARLEMKSCVEFLAEPAKPGEGVGACVRRAATNSGLTYGQVWRLWYKKRRIIPLELGDKIRDAVKRHEQRLDAELATLKTRYWALTHHSSDPEFYAQRVSEVCPPRDSGE